MPARPHRRWANIAIATRWYAECDFIRAINDAAPGIVATLGDEVFPRFAQAEAELVAARDAKKPEVLGLFSNGDLDMAAKYVPSMASHGPSYPLCAAAMESLKEWLQGAGLDVPFMRSAIAATFDDWRGEAAAYALSGTQFVEMRRAFADWYRAAERWHQEHPNSRRGEHPPPPPPLPPRRPAARRVRLKSHDSPMESIAGNALDGRPPLPELWNPLRESFETWDERLRAHNQALRTWAHDELNYGPATTPHKWEHYLWAARRQCLKESGATTAKWWKDRLGRADEPEEYRRTIERATEAVRKTLGLPVVTLPRGRPKLRQVP